MLYLNYLGLLPTNLNQTLDSCGISSRILIVIMLPCWRKKPQSPEPDLKVYQQVKGVWRKQLELGVATFADDNLETLLRYWKDDRSSAERRRPRE
jgi:hypothetical protein